MKNFNMPGLDKKIRVLMIISILALWGCAASPPPEPASPEDMLIKKVLEIPGVSKKQLFENAKLWIANTFGTSLDVIQYSNSSEGSIIGKTSFPHQRPGKFGADDFDFRFTVIIETRDNKFRATFTDMYLMSYHGIKPILKSDMEVIRPKLENAVREFASFSINNSNNDKW